MNKLITTLLALCCAANAGEYDRSQATIKTSQNANTEEVLPMGKE
jgi:hypothetical protein